MKITLKIEGLPPLPNRMRFQHWAVQNKQNQDWKKTVVQATIQRCFWKDKELADAMPFKQAKLTLTRHSEREPDFDNLVASFKSVADGLVEAGVIVDDKPSVIVESKYQWIKEKRAHGHITITVESVAGSGGAIRAV